MKISEIYIENIGKTTLDSQMYISSGGEADIYKVGSLVVKIFFNKKRAIDPKKIIELSKISSINVIKPLHIVYDNKNNIIGYAMIYIDNVDPICKLFTKSFKATNNIQNSDVIEIVKHMQKTICNIHSANCLVVDLNELNIMVDISKCYSYFIDVDSYQTKSFKATAIMEAIRDRLIKNNQWNEMSDWFSFGIIAFQMYIGIHPYKGSHPNYKPNEWSKRMDDGISVFDKHVSLPAVCNSFKVIPTRHLEWMKDVFIHNKREIPPDIDASIPIVVPEQIIIIKSNDVLEIAEVCKINENIKKYYNFFGVNYYITPNHIMKDSIVINSSVKENNKVELIQSNVNNILLARLKCKNVIVEDMNGTNIFTVQSNDMMVYDNILYTYNHNGLFQNTFLTANNKTIPMIKKIGNVSENATKLFNGVIYQNLLGKHWLIFPLENRIIYGEIKELSGFRIIDMERKKHVCIVIAEKGGIYHKFVILVELNKSTLTYTIRHTDNINYDSINFTVLENGICVMLDEQDLVLFRDLKNLKVINNNVIDASMKLYAIGNKVHIVENKSLYTVTMK